MMFRSLAGYPALLLFATAFLAPSAASDAAAEEQSASSALLADGQCDDTVGGTGGGCALSALQLRGQKVVASDNATDEEGGLGSCQSYGCVGYMHGHGCQCNSKCQQYSNCCSDYSTLCVAHASAGGSCQSYGCTGYMHGHACQCNGKCQQYGNCCSDYSTHCVAHASAGGSCQSYGCSGYVQGNACQCNGKCHQYGNCCSDYEARCASHAVAPPGGPSPPSGGPSPSGGKVYGHPRPGAQYPNRPGFSLMLVEEFDAPLDLDTDPIWTWSDGGLQEGSMRFTKEQIKFENGMMVIEMSNIPAAHTQPCSHAEKKVIPHRDKSSGEFRSKHNMFRYGFYEVRMKAPVVKPGNPFENGNFISTMFVFRDGKFKHWREIDIEVTGDTKGQVSSNVLVGEDRVEWSADMEHGKIWQAPFNTRSAFHTYSFEWLPNRIRWFADGSMIREWHGTIPELSTKIMMNLWMFDKRALFGGKKIWNNVLPMRNEYDWFRFYKWDGDQKYPCPGMGTECLTADDMYLSSNNPCDGVQQTGTIQGKGVCTASCR